MPKTIFSFLLLLFIYNLYFVGAGTARASGSSLLINEIYTAPLEGEAEQIELFNDGLLDYDLSLCTIEDGTNKPEALDGILPSGGYLTLSKSTDFAFGLNNDGDRIILICAGETTDLVTYGNFDDGNTADNAPAGASGKSLARFPNGMDSGVDLSDFSALSPTLGAENLRPSYSDSIIINEAVPQPAEGSDTEFIELFNSGTVPVDLSGWQIDDAEAGSSPYTLGQIILKAGEYMAFYKEDSGLALNDTGDTARLLDPNNELKSSVSYDKAEVGESYSLISGVWRWSTTITPNLTNIFTEILPDEETALDDSAENLPDLTREGISAARERDDGERVLVKGVVTVLPGVLSAQYFYIEDGSGGLQVYSYRSDFPSLEPGQEIEVRGTLSQYFNERRLKISDKADIIVLQTGEVPLGKEAEIGAIGEDDEGEIVKVEGFVTETSGDVFFLSDENANEIKVIIRSGTGIDKPPMKKGDYAMVRGVVSQYKEEYRILPIGVEDVKIITPDELPRAGPESNYLLISGILFIIWNLLAIVKKRLKPWLLIWQREAKAAISWR